MLNANEITIVEMMIERLCEGGSLKGLFNLLHDHNADALFRQVPDLHLMGKQDLDPDVKEQALRACRAMITASEK